MISLLKFLGIASALATSSATYSLRSAQGRSLTKEVEKHGNKVLVSDFQRSDSKWIFFPEQMELHSAVLNGNNPSESKVELDGSFWSSYGSLLGLTQSSEMVLVKSDVIKGSRMTQNRFDQLVHGVKVYGGEFLVTLGAHGGVVRAHGLALPTGSIKNSASLRVAPKVDIPTALSVLESYIDKRNNEHSLNRVQTSSIRVSLYSGVSKVWHNSLFGVARQGRVTLAYHVNGRIGETSEEFLAFDAFVNCETGDVIDFIQRIQEAEAPSPFASPIQNATIYVYDQWRKDLNDDQEDDDRNPDPDLYSNLTLVFTTTDDSYVYPTTDAEMNLLIDNTLYIKYMYYSLSGGEYLTWNLTETDLNIEYNLSLANAYFDGYWGIHFGTGFITDDVVSHEWSHGYTQTGNGLIYAYQPGAMNEAFSDIFGETVDILNHDTTDPTVHRTEWPTQCHQTLNSAYGIPPGTDFGTRWSMGENVSYYYYANGDGSLRDMYKPECFFEPSTTFADDYVCTTYYDNGAVHKNSGVLNRLYAVLTDGGVYEDPTSSTGALLNIDGLGFVKASNLFWRAHQALIATSQFMDMAVALSNECRLSVNSVLYYPNLFNYSIIQSSETLTSADCDNVDNAILGSGMNSEHDFCPNIVCANEDFFPCMWAKCPFTEFQARYENYNHMMGSAGPYSISAVCKDQAQDSSYARVFNQSVFDGQDIDISCIQVGYALMGHSDFTVTVYIDSNGGSPDYASMRQIGSTTVSGINSYGKVQVQTASFATPLRVDFQSPQESLVVLLTVPTMTEGYIYGAGDINGAVVNTVGETFVSGACSDTFTPYNKYATQYGNPSGALTQWYVRVHASTATDDVIVDGGDDSDDGLSTTAIVGISVGATIGAIALLAVIGFVIYKYVFAAPKKEGLLAGQM